MKKTNPLLLKDCIASYLKYLNTPSYKNRKRSISVIKCNARFLNYYTEALAKHNENISTLEFTSIDEKVVGYVYNYALGIKKFSNRTFNNFIYSLKRFTDYTISAQKLNYKNPFLNICKKITPPTKDSFINIDQFLRLLEIVTPENGNYRIRQRTINLYRPWLKDAYWLGLLTGARKNEISNFRWSDIKLNPNNEMSYIEISTLNNKKIKYSITTQLKSKLNDLGYDVYKDTDKYILAPEEDTSRESISHLIGISFTHYFKILEISRQFKDLRKTFLVKKYMHNA